MREIEVEIDALLTDDFDPASLLADESRNALGAPPEAFLSSGFTAKFAVGLDDESSEEIVSGGDVYDLLASGSPRFATGDAHNIAVGGLFGDIGKAVKNVTKSATRAVAKGVGSVEKVAGKIPVVGKPLHAALGAANEPFRLADKIARGARIDRAVLGSLKKQLTSARTLAPYAQTVVSMVPGVGSGVSAAIGAATALAQGRPITEAAIAAVRASVPGGPLAQGGFDLAQRLAKGQKVTSAVLASARAQLPKEAQAAFDTSLALAQGKKLQSALVKGVLKLAPSDMAPLAKTGAALAKIDPKLRGLRNVLSGKEKIGLDLANGMLAHSGVPEHAVLALRQKLGPEAKRGFDAALSVQARLAEKGELDRIPTTIKPSTRAPLASAPRAPAAAARAPSYEDGADFSADEDPDEGAEFMASGGMFSDVTDKIRLAAKAAAAARRAGATPEQARVIARKVIQRRGSGVEGGSKITRLLKSLTRARLAERQGHALAPGQIRLLASFRAMHARAKAGNPRAQRFLGLFRSEVARLRAAKAASSHAAGAWAPTVRWGGAPTGDVFVGATALREC